MTVEFECVEPSEAFWGTHLLTHIDVPFNRLVDVFGEPGPPSDPYKIDVEWFIQFADGAVATIYNYKDGSAYLEPRGNAVTDIRSWHVSGHDDRVIDRVTRLLNPEG